MFGFSKLMALIDLFRHGESLANAGVWKTGGMVLQLALATFFGGLNPVLAAFGVPFHFDEATSTGLAVGVVTIVNLVFTLITSDKVGILPAKSTE